MYSNLAQELDKLLAASGLHNLQELDKHALSKPYQTAWEPNSVTQTATIITHKFEQTTIASLIAAGIGGDKITTTPLEEASAQLLPNAYYGPALACAKPTTDLVSTQSNSSFSTQLNTKLNNFLPFQIPFYNSSVAQRVGKTGSEPLPGTSRAIALIDVDSQGVTSPDAVVGYVSGGEVVPWWKLPSQLQCPCYGIYLDRDPNYGKPITLSASLDDSGPTNSLQTQLAVYAAPNFTFGEFIGLPKIQVNITDLLKSSASVKPDSGIFK